MSEQREKVREAIIDYFHELDRGYFMETAKGAAAMDMAVPIGFGQTISQPTLVLRMTKALDLKPDLRVLEIGTGSGYQTALLAPFCKEVFTVERLEPLYKKAKKRLAAKELNNIQFKLGDGSVGWSKHAPYDRIIVTASAAEIPDELLEQLNFYGKMIIPVGDDNRQQLQLIEKDMDGKLTTTVLEEVVFVRLKGKYE